MRKHILKNIVKAKTKKIRDIICFVLIQLLCVSSFVLAAEQLTSLSFPADEDIYTLSPQLNIPVDSFKSLYATSQGKQYNLQEIGDFDLPDNFTDEVKRRMRLINRAVLGKFRFDTNADFYRRYRQDLPYGNKIDLIEKINQDKGGLCLEQSAALQKYAYAVFKAGKFFGNVFRGSKVEIRIVKPLDDDYVYELEITVAGKSYRIKGYIIGALACDENLKLNERESQMMVKGHYANMTKVILPSGKEEVFIHEPGWAIVDGINSRDKIKSKKGYYYLKQTSKEHIDDYINANSELGWLNNTFEGRLWRNKAIQNGFTLFVENKAETVIKYIFIDEPAENKDIKSFSSKYMRLRGLVNQNIIKTNLEGRIKALVQIFMHNPKHVISPKSVRKMKNSEDIMPFYMIMYYKGIRRELLGYDDLENIYYEIKNSKFPYSEKTELFLKGGYELGMVLDSQMGKAAYNSEFFKRFEVLFDRSNREHFIDTINDWTIDPDRDNLLNNKTKTIDSKGFLIREAALKMEERLGEKFARNVHHGLAHSLDLIERARNLTAMLGKTAEVDWKALTAAIYLHDIFAEETEFHGKQASDFSDKILREMDVFTEAQAAKIKQAVEFHDKKISGDANSVEEELAFETKLLYDIDNLDAFGVKGIYRYFSAHISRGLNKGMDASQVLDIIKQRVAYNVEQRRNNLYFMESRQLADIDFPVTKMFFDKLVEEAYPAGAKKGATGVFSFIWDNFNDMPWQIAEKAHDYFYGQDNLNDEDEIFARMFFKKLEQQYAGLKEKMDASKNSADLIADPSQKLQFKSIIEVVEQSI